jgi:hypothetical protein
MAFSVGTARSLLPARVPSIENSFTAVPNVKPSVPPTVALFVTDTLLRVDAPVD